MKSRTVYVSIAAMGRLLWLIFFLSSHLAATQMSIQAKSCLLINAKSGHVLYEKNPYLHLSPASTVKIATALYCMELQQNWNTRVSVPSDCIGAVSEEEKRRKNYSQPPHWLVFDACHMGLKKDEELTLLELLEGMLITSADDASNVLAHHFGQGSISQFTHNLNLFLQSIGCEHTHLKNPHGLYHPEQYSCAYDLALMARKAIQHPLFAHIVQKTSYQRPKTNKQDATTLAQTNKLLRKKSPFYKDYVTGIKTGYIQDAGYCIVASATKEDRTYIAVVLGAKSSEQRYQDVITLLEHGIHETPTKTLCLPIGIQPFKITSKQHGTLETFLEDALHVETIPSNQEEFTAHIQWLPLTPPLVHGEQIGHLEIKNQYQEIKSHTPLLLHSPPKKPVPWPQSLPWKSVGGLILISLFFGLALHLSK